MKKNHITAAVTLVAAVLSIFLWNNKLKEPLFEKAEYKDIPTEQHTIFSPNYTIDVPKYSKVREFVGKKNSIIIMPPKRNLSTINMSYSANKHTGNYKNKTKIHDREVYYFIDQTDGIEGSSGSHMTALYITFKVNEKGWVSIATTAQDEQVMDETSPHFYVIWNLVAQLAKQGKTK